MSICSCQRALREACGWLAADGAGMYSLFLFFLRPKASQTLCHETVYTESCKHFYFYFLHRVQTLWAGALCLPCLQELGNCLRCDKRSLGNNRTLGHNSQFIGHHKLQVVCLANIRCYKLLPKVSEQYVCLFKRRNKSESLKGGYEADVQKSGIRCPSSRLTTPPSAADIVGFYTPPFEMDSLVLSSPPTNSKPSTGLVY